MARTAQEVSREATLNHVAKALKAYMKRNKLSMRDFNEQVLKVGPRNVSAYNWLAGRGLPSKAFVPVLAKALNKPHSFFDARSAVVREVEQRNGEAVEAVVPEVSQEALEALEELTGGTAPATPSLPTQSVLEARKRVVSHARNPRVIARERVVQAPIVRAPTTVREVLDGEAKNSLTYWSNGDGSATVTMLFRAERQAAQKVFAALADLGVDIIETDVDR